MTKPFASTSHKYLVLAQVVSKQKSMTFPNGIEVSWSITISRDLSIARAKPGAPPRFTVLLAVPRSLKKVIQGS